MYLHYCGSWKLVSWALYYAFSTVEKTLVKANSHLRCDSSMFQSLICAVKGRQVHTFTAVWMIIPTQISLYTGHLPPKIWLLHLLQWKIYDRPWGSEKDGWGWAGSWTDLERKDTKNIVLNSWLRPSLDDSCDKVRSVEDSGWNNPCLSRISRPLQCFDFKSIHSV